MLYTLTHMNTRHEATILNEEPLFPLSAEDFVAREALEGDPNSYTVRIHNGVAALYEKLDSGVDMACEVDLRGDVAKGSKYVIWIGTGHTNLAQDAQFSMQESMKDYCVSGFFHFDKEHNKISVRRGEDIGNPSYRTDEQVENIAAAIESALQRDLIDERTE